MTSSPLDSTDGWQRRAWHAITALGQHTQSKDVKRGMKSPPLDNTHGRTTSGMTCHHCLWTAHTIERRWAWHAIITFGQHKRSDGIGRGMPLSPLDGKHGRMMLGVECHHLLWQYARSKSSGVACHHGIWTPHTIERSRSSHAIIAH